MIKFIYQESLIFLILIMLNVSCQNDSSNINLSGDYWVTANNRTVESNRKEFLYKNKVYPVVIDYAFDSTYILIEQLVDSSRLIEQIASNLHGRYKMYKMFENDHTLLTDSFYIPFVEFVQKDSAIYNLFLQKGASDDNSANIGISINVAREIVQDDSNYAKIIKNKYNYWILDVLPDSLLGPFTKDEYLQRRRIMKIPSSIKLSFEN